MRCARELQRLLSANSRALLHQAKLLEAARTGDAAAVEALIAAGVRTGARDSNCCTGLHWAALLGHVDVAQLLLQAPGGARLARKRTACVRDPCSRCLRVRG